MFTFSRDSKDIALLALVGLGLYSQSNELNLANNTTILLLLFLLYTEHEKIEELKHDACCTHKEMHEIKREVHFEHKDLQELKHEVNCVENLTNTGICKNCHPYNCHNNCHNYCHCGNGCYEARIAESQRFGNKCCFA